MGWHDNTGVQLMAAILGYGIDSPPAPCWGNPVVRGYIAEVAAAPPSVTPPTITIVSPTPGVPVGAAGGFSSDYALARDTPVIVQITDAAPGNRLVVVIALIAGVPEVVYVTGAGFRTGYASASTAAAIANGVELAIRRGADQPTTSPRRGWPGSGLGFEVYAVDAAGAMTP